MSTKGDYKKTLKKKKQELKDKIKSAVTENEKVKLAKQLLGDAYEKYKGFIELIPEVEERIQEIEQRQDENPEELKLWKNVLTNLEHVRDRPKAMKVYYSKKVLKQIKKIKQKYPG